MKAVLCALTIFVSGSVAHAQTVTLINPGVDNRIATISGVTINGSLWDATFHHGIRFNDLPPPQFTFGGASPFDFSQSVPAAQAIATVVGSLPDETGPTASALIPNGTFGGGSRVTLAWIRPQFNYSNWAPSDVVPAFTSTNYVLPQDYAWVTFERSSVPEPSSLTVAAMILGWRCFATPTAAQKANETWIRIDRVLPARMVHFDRSIHTKHAFGPTCGLGFTDEIGFSSTTEDLHGANQRGFREMR